MSAYGLIEYNLDMRKTITFTSRFDGTEQRAVVIAPDDAHSRPIPLVIVPHAAGWTDEMTADYWKDIPVRHGVTAVFPFGHSRALDLRSLAWRGQIADMAAVPDTVEKLGYQVDRDRVFAVGISMGGMESLVLAGMHPELLAGVVSFNALVDIAQWFHDCDPGARSHILQEMGGTPDERPAQYAERSPINYPATISRVPSLLYWDPNDEVVQFQEKKQSGRLFELVKQANPDAPIWAKRHQRGHTYVNPGAALKWLLGLPKESLE